MHRLVLNTLFIFLTFSLPAQAREKILVTGSSTIAPLMLEIAKAYEKEHLDLRIDIQTGGSTKGIVDQRRGTSGLGMVSRSLKSSEKDLTAYLIARDGLGFIVNRENPLKNITDQQALDIYQGRITNWKALRGPDKKITVVHKAEGHSTLEVFLKYFKIKNSTVKANIIIKDNEQGIKTIAGNKYAIGYVSIGTAQFNEHLGVPIRTLSLNGVDGTVENVKKGRYPLARELNLVTKGQSNQAVKQLIRYALSKKVAPLVEQFYFIPPSQ